MKFQGYVDWDANIDIPENVPGLINPEWFKNITLVPPVEKSAFIETLNANTLLFAVLRNILEKKFELMNSREFDFNRPNVEQTLLYYEGYKQAIKDLHRLIPRP